MKIFLTFSFFLIAALGSFSSTYAAVNTSTSADTGTDQEIAKKIQDYLKGGWFSKSYEGVNVRVNNGKVTLSGTVPTNEDKQKIEKDVRNINGVRQLSSDLKATDNKGEKEKEFPQDAYATSADEQLNKKIRDQISKGWVWNSYKDISLHTSNGEVTLEGTVESIDDQYKLMEDVGKVEGVKRVKSNLKISKEKKD